MSRWSEYRDRYVKPVAAAATLNPAIVAGSVGSVVPNPVIAGGALGYEATKENGSGSDIPGMDEARQTYRDISGQTAADAAEEAARIQREGIEYAADVQLEMFERGLETQQPWLEAGGRALTELESMMGQAPTFEDYQMSDYSKFLQDEAMKAIEAKSRAGGYYHTGGTSREMMQYAQDIAGQDYQQYLSNYYQSLNPYMSLAGLGQQQAQVSGQQAMQAGQAQGQYAIGAAQATASGLTGAAAARQQGLSNIIGTGALLYGMSR